MNSIKNSITSRLQDSKLFLHLRAIMHTRTYHTNVHIEERLGRRLRDRTDYKLFMRLDDRLFEVVRRM